MDDTAPIAPEVLSTMSGLEMMRALSEGRLTTPGIGRLVGFRLAEVALGRSTFVSEPGPQHYNPLGFVHGGYAATLLDSCMGCAVHTTLAAGMGYTTLELKVSYVRGMTAATGAVRAEGTVLNSGRRVAFAEGRLTDGRGRLIAHATTTCLVFPMTP